MEVRIKNLDIIMQVKSKGIEFEVREPNRGKHLGDCYLTMVGLTWCVGKTSKAKGVELTWRDLTEILGSSAKKTAALKAARGT